MTTRKNSSTSKAAQPATTHHASLTLDQVDEIEKLASQGKGIAQLAADAADETHVVNAMWAIKDAFAAIVEIVRMGGKVQS